MSTMISTFACSFKHVPCIQCLQLGGGSEGQDADTTNAVHLAELAEAKVSVLMAYALQRVLEIHLVGMAAGC